MVLAGDLGDGVAESLEGLDAAGAGGVGGVGDPRVVDDLFGIERLETLGVFFRPGVGRHSQPREAGLPGGHIGRRQFVFGDGHHQQRRAVGPRPDPPYQHADQAKRQRQPGGDLVAVPGFGGLDVLADRAAPPRAPGCDGPDEAGRRQSAFCGLFPRPKRPTGCEVSPYRRSPLLWMGPGTPTARTGNYRAIQSWGQVTLVRRAPNAVRSSRKPCSQRLPSA